MCFTNICFLFICSFVSYPSEFAHPTPVLSESSVASWLSGTSRPLSSRSLRLEVRQSPPAHSCKQPLSPSHYFCLFCVEEVVCCFSFFKTGALWVVISVVDGFHNTNLLSYQKYGRYCCYITLTTLTTAVSYIKFKYIIFILVSVKSYLYP